MNRTRAMLRDLLETGVHRLVGESSERGGGNRGRSTQSGLATDQARELLLEQLCQRADRHAKDFVRFLLADDERKAAHDEVAGQRCRHFLIRKLHDRATAEVVKTTQVAEVADGADSEFVRRDLVHERRLTAIRARVQSLFIRGRSSIGRAPRSQCGG